MIQSAGGNSSRYFKLGVFMLLGVALLAGGVVALGARSLFQRKIAAETLVYDSVNGLDVGSAVKYRGVPIGEVTGVIFASAKYAQAATTIAPAATCRDVRGVLVEMDITQQAFPGKTEQEIKELAVQLVDRGMRARVTPAGISGQSYVEFDILDSKHFPPPPMNWKPDVLYIPSAPSPLNQVIDAVSDIASQLQQADLGKLVRHIDDLAAEALDAVGNVSGVMRANRENLNRTLSNLPETATALKAAAARAEQILRDPRVERTLTGLANVGDSAGGAIADIRLLVREAEALLSGESDDVRGLIADLRRLAADGAALTDDARQNPSRLLFGRPPTPEPPLAVGR